VLIRAVLARNALIYSLVIPPCVPRDLSGTIFFSGAGNLVDRMPAEIRENEGGDTIRAGSGIAIFVPISTAHGIAFIANSGDFHAIDITAPTGKSVSDGRSVNRALITENQPAISAMVLAKSHRKTALATGAATHPTIRNPGCGRERPQRLAHDRGGAIHFFRGLPLQNSSVAVELAFVVFE
jgi:hypothetical protein